MSYLTVSVADPAITLQWDATLADLQNSVSLDTDRDGNVSHEEALDHQAALSEYCLSRLKLRLDGVEARLHLASLSIKPLADGDYAVMTLTTEGRSNAREIEIDFNAFFDVEPTHRGLYQVKFGGIEQSGIFRAGHQHQRIELRRPTLGPQLAVFLSEGILHIWLGFDHILFLLALLLPSVLRRTPGGWQFEPSLRPALTSVAKIVTAFTLAHSITLGLATFGLVRLPPRLVETTIALSIVFAAATNLRALRPNRAWIMAAGFGLIHGFGFADALANLSLARHSMALALVGFNLGVEAGQFAIVAVFLPVAFVFRKTWAYQRVVVQGGSVAISLIALIWMLERAFAMTIRTPG